MRLRLLLLVPWLLIAGCASEDAPGDKGSGNEAGVGPPGTGAGRPEATGLKPDELWFEECALERGLLFRHESGHDGTYLFPEIMGGGAAILDVDGDGDQDVYAVQSGSLTTDRADRTGNRLFLNDGDGHFEERADSGSEDTGYGQGVATGDVDGDGDLELFVTNLDRNTLLANEGGGRFRDITEEAGVGESGWAVSAAFFDLERDGDLDLFVVNYISWSIADELNCETPPYGKDYCSPRSYRRPAPDTLFRNAGDGSFQDVSFDAGLRSAFGNGLGVVAGDFDADGYEDVFVANDATLNQLWINRQNGQLVDRAVLFGCAADEHGVPKAGMGVHAADVDRDGDEDLLVVNLAQQSDSFYRNDGEHFSDRTPVFGLGVASRPYTRFGCGFHDFDNDGQLDLFLANGRVTRANTPLVADPYAEENLLLTGNGKSFRPVPDVGLAERWIATSRGASFGDVDGDGGVDVLVINRDDRAHLFRNVRGVRGEWLRVRLRSGEGPLLGSEVEVEAGGERWIRRVRTAYSYCAASERVVHVGLGEQAVVEAVRVRWPDGVQEEFGPFEAGHEVELVRGSGRE